jgi:hypothetical protein
VHAIEPGPASNKLLVALPRSDFALLQPRPTTVGLEQGMVLCEAGDEVDHVHFPLSGMISLVVVMRNGKGIETATVGREGVQGSQRHINSPPFIDNGFAWIVFADDLCKTFLIFDDWIRRAAQR